jgi:glycine/D-amino acid oxidase-like deaminating enzyme
MWPYRFVTAVWNTLLKQYPDQIRIEANTPVVSIDDSGSATHPYHVYTDRGLVRCQHVVHATNAYMSHLLPALKNKSTAVRAHMSAQNLGYQVYESLHGRRSWSIVYGKNDYDYMTQRPSANNTGDTMLGGGAFRSKKNGLDQIGVWDDSRTEAFTSAHLAGLLPIIFLPNNKPRQPEGQSRLLQQHWSGIIALTADSLPFVGELDARWCRRGSGRAAQGAAEWIAAGYNGQGMAFAWLCGIALGIRITSSSHEDLAPFPGIPGGRLMEWLPVELSVSHKRYDSIDVLDLADEL